MLKLCSSLPATQAGGRLITVTSDDAARSWSRYQDAVWKAPSVCSRMPINLAAPLPFGRGALDACGVSTAATVRHGSLAGATTRVRAPRAKVCASLRSRADAQTLSAHLSQTVPWADFHACRGRGVVAVDGLAPCELSAPRGGHCAAAELVVHRGSALAGRLRGAGFSFQSFPVAPTPYLRAIRIHAVSAAAALRCLVQYAVALPSMSEVTLPQARRTRCRM